MAEQLSVTEVFGGVEFLDRLIEELNEVYPQPHPLPSDSMQTIMYESGQRSVVEYLISKKTNV